MPRRIIERIRERFRLQQYDMTSHAMEELAEDGLNILDLEHAVLGGGIARVEKDDPRGTRYVIEGSGIDRTAPVGVVVRFIGPERCLVITAYRITAMEG